MPTQLPALFATIFYQRIYLLLCERKLRVGSSRPKTPQPAAVYGLLQLYGLDNQRPETHRSGPHTIPSSTELLHVVQVMLQAPLSAGAGCGSASAPGCWRQVLSKSARNKAAWLTSPNPSTPAARTTRLHWHTPRKALMRQWLRGRVGVTGRRTAHQFDEPRTGQPGPPCHARCSASTRPTNGEQASQTPHGEHLRAAVDAWHTATGSAHA